MEKPRLGLPRTFGLKHLRQLENMFEFEKSLISEGDYVEIIEEVECSEVVVGGAFYGVAVIALTYFCHPNTIKNRNQNVATHLLHHSRAPWRGKYGPVYFTGFGAAAKMQQSQKSWWWENNKEPLQLAHRIVRLREHRTKYATTQGKLDRWRVTPGNVRIL